MNRVIYFGIMINLSTDHTSDIFPSGHVTSSCVTSYYRGAMGIMLVYDITNHKTFENISKWLRNIDEHANEDVEKMILGNKCDMDSKRQVSKERGDVIAKEHGVPFLETSAKANINVEKAFMDLAQAILNKTPGRDMEPSRGVDINTRDRQSKGSCCS